MKNVALRQEAEAMQEQLIGWRRELHQMPEVGTQLPRTMAYLQQQLTEMGIESQFHAEISCLEATIGQGGKCFLLRADVDALPVQEEAEVSFRSTNGNMHGCGHDLHGTMLLGAAKLLKDHEKELKGTVKLLFQSGEEVFQGAKAAIAAGVLENPKVDGALALHVIAMLPMGLVMTGKKPMASVDGFRVTITGRGGHGSMPEACVDPINAAVQVYLALQSLIAREIGGTEEAVLTIGQLSAGEVPNVIPERAVLQGTLRTFQPEVRERLRKRMQEISVGVAAAYRCQAEYTVLSECASVVTDETVTEQVAESIRAVAPELHLVPGAHGMGSEDFAEITQKVPAAYFMLGAGPEEESKRFAQHNPKIQFNEAVLPIGAAVYARSAMDFLIK